MILATTARRLPFSTGAADVLAFRVVCDRCDAHGPVGSSTDGATAEARTAGFVAAIDAGLIRHYCPSCASIRLH